MNKETFFAKIRTSLFNKTMSQKQVDGVNALLLEWDNRKLTDSRWLAYMLATCFHETAHTMQPVEEYGKGKGWVYGTPDKETGKVYYGRGFVQLTWIGNYQKFGKLLNLPLVIYPELAMQLDVSTQILFEGMLNGLFTGKCLSDYLNGDDSDWQNARRVVNGKDCCETIAGYAKKFYEALNA